MSALRLSMKGWNQPCGAKSATSSFKTSSRASRRRLQKRCGGQGTRPFTRSNPGCSPGFQSSPRRAMPSRRRGGAIAAWCQLSTLTVRRGLICKKWRFGPIGAALPLQEQEVSEIGIRISSGWSKKIGQDLRRGTSAVRGLDRHALRDTVSCSAAVTECSAWPQTHTG